MKKRSTPSIFSSPLLLLLFFQTASCQVLNDYRVTGTFATTNLPAGYAIIYNTNSVALVKAAAPATWVSFSGKVTGNAVTLDWVTGIESNTDHFDIERSADGQSFITIGEVNAAGNSSGNTRYTYTKKESANFSGYFYRLKEVDLDGKSNYSTVIKIPLNTNPVFSLTITPNPVRDMLKITASGIPVNEILLLEIVSTSGIAIYRSSMRTTGMTTVKLVLRPASPAGIYFYRIIRKSNGQMLRGRVVFL